MPLIITAHPAVEPVSLAEAKAHLRVDIPDDDALISSLIAAARQHAETICRRALVTQSWKMTLDRFPAPGMNISSANWYGPQWGIGPGPLSVISVDGKTGYEIFLPMPPLQTVDSIKYIDQDGIQQTLDPSAYKVDNISEPARIVPSYGNTWPSTRNEVNAVEVNFTCGYGGAADVPEGIKRWMLLRVGSLYQHREEMSVMPIGRLDPLPFVDSLLESYRVIVL